MAIWFGAHKSFFLAHDSASTFSASWFGYKTLKEGFQINTINWLKGITCKTVYRMIEFLLILLLACLSGIGRAVSKEN